MSRQAILTACAKEHVKVDVLSRGWLFRLEKNGRVRHMFKNCLALNSQSAGAIAADKFATYEVLRAANIPVIDHAILYPFDNHRDFAEDCNTMGYLKRYFDDHHQDIVLKPNRGFGGQGITHITSPDQFPDALAEAFRHSESASLCPFYHIRREYRIIMLDGEARLIYGKTRGADWRFNLQNGALASPVTDEALRSRLIDLAKRTTQELNLRFCSVDIIEPTNSGPTNSDFINTTDTNHDTDVTPNLIVIEVNSAAETKHYCEQHPEDAELVENIYRDAIRKMFE